MVDANAIRVALWDLVKNEDELTPNEQLEQFNILWRKLHA